MKRIISLIALTFLVLVAPVLLLAQSTAGSDLFQRALQQERVGGNLQGAIALYRRILAEHLSDRALVARTLVQMGAAYEKLGSDEARKAYERVLREFPEQSTQAVAARTRLDALRAGRETASTSEPAVRRLWSGQDVDVLGAPTRDGRLLTFVDWSTGDLAVRNLSTGENRRLTNKGPWTASTAFALSSVPSPDGKRVAYSWTETAQNEIRVIGMDGSNMRVLFSSPEVEYASPIDWADAGRQILTYLRRKDRTGQIVLIGTADSSILVLKTLGWGAPSRIALSPDGRYVAYDLSAGEGAGQQDIHVIPITGGDSSPFITHSANDHLIGWTPGGNDLLFMSDRTGPMSIWLAPQRNGRPAGEPVLLRRDAEFTMFPLGLTAGGSLIYSANASPIDIFTVALDQATGKATGTPSRVVDRYVGANRAADWSPDGRRIVYLSRRTPRSVGSLGSALIVRTPGEGSEIVVPVKLENIVWPRWSPDGSHIVVSAQDRGGADGLYRIDPVTGDAALILPGRHQMLGWSSDRAALFLLQRDFQKKIFGIVRQGLDGGTPQDIFHITGSPGRTVNIGHAAVSPAGDRIAFTHLGDSVSHTLKVVPASGGEARTILRKPEGQEFQSLSWSHDGRFILFSMVRVERKPDGSLTTNAAAAPLMRVSVDGGTPEEMGVTGDAIASIRPSPDGRRLLFTAGQSVPEVWVMENFLPRRGRGVRDSGTR